MEAAGFLRDLLLLVIGAAVGVIAVALHAYRASEEDSRAAFELGYQRGRESVTDSAPLGATEDPREPQRAHR